MSGLVFEIFICFLAGTGAGLGTGFAGMSAATVISPMLLTFLGLPAYDAVGIALASDVLASAVSARTYARQGYLDLKNGLVMMAGVLSMTMAGSWLSSFVPDGTLGSFSVVMTLVLGLKFLLTPAASGQEGIRDPAHRFLKGAVGGCVIGLICGFFGAGGRHDDAAGAHLLPGLPPQNRREHQCLCHDLFGPYRGGEPFCLRGVPRLDLLALCALFTLLWARIGARIATRARPAVLNRVVGIILTVLGLVLLWVSFL